MAQNHDASDDLQRTYKVLSENVEDETVEWGETIEGEPTVKVQWQNGDDLMQEVYEYETFPGTVDIVSTGVKTYVNGEYQDPQQIYVVLRDTGEQ